MIWAALAVILLISVLTINASRLLSARRPHVSNLFLCIGIGELALAIFLIALEITG